MNKIDQAVAEELEILPMSWILIAADEDNSIYTATSAGLPYWQQAGLIHWAASFIQAQPVWTESPECYEEEN